MKISATTVVIKIVENKMECYATLTLCPDTNIVPLKFLRTRAEQ